MERLKNTYAVKKNEDQMRILPKRESNHSVGFMDIERCLLVICQDLGNNHVSSADIRASLVGLS